MIKQFIKERSKIQLVIVILSVILLFVGILPEFINYSEWAKDLTLAYSEGIDTSLTTEQRHMSLFSMDFGNFFDVQMILLTCFMFISIILNIASYIYKKLELLFISISFIVLVILLNLFSFDITGSIVFGIIILFDIFAYIEQYKINKPKIKK